MKSFNATAPDILNKHALQSLARLYDRVLHSLAIIALYTPLVWYVLYLRRLYPGNINLLDIAPLHLLIVIALLVAPLLILHKLGVNWRNKENTPPEF